MWHPRVMDTTPRPIPELVEERKALSAQLADINRKLEKLDSELFSRLETALNAFGMWGPAQAATPGAAPRAPARPAFFPPPLPTAPSGPALRQQEWVLGAPKPTPPRHGEVGPVIQKLTWRFIKEGGKPLKTREIMSLLEKEGVKIPGKDPVNNLSAHLSRSHVFVNTRFGWRVREEQEPPEGGS